MNAVWLGMGSNCHAPDNLASCLDALLLQFRDLALSSVYESAAAGQQGQPYLNMVVGLQTDMPLLQLNKLLKSLEQKHGRREQGQGNVPLDIDILLYANKAGNFDGITLPRPEILTAPYVLCPLAQVAGKQKHPVSKTSYGDLWEAFDKSAVSISAVDFTWHERRISHAATVV